jgi:hypothetical protein
MENKKVNKSFRTVYLEKPHPPTREADFVLFICRQDGAQDGEFVANRSTRPTYVKGTITMLCGCHLP